MKILLAKKKAGSEPHRSCPSHKLKSSLAEGPDISMRWEWRESRYQRRPAGCSLGKRFSWAVLWTLKWKVLGTRSCLTLCDSMDCKPTGLLCPWNSPGQNAGVGSCFLLQGIFPTQRPNLGFLYCKQILHRLSLQGTPKSKTIDNSDIYIHILSVKYGSPTKSFLE